MGEKVVEGREYRPRGMIDAGREEGREYTGRIGSWREYGFWKEGRECMGRIDAGREGVFGVGEDRCWEGGSIRGWGG